MMEVQHLRCAGLDVHKDTVVACVRVVRERDVFQEVKTFDTTTQSLLALSDWLGEHECTHAAMESTGVYWKPVWHVLEASIDLVLANAMHIRKLPGRKTDVNDATWIADLLAHGLIRSSFVPPTHVQELRDLTRTRKQLVREVAQHTQRIQKTLEDANIKMTGLFSDILGKSGRAILEALIAGESDPERLVDLTGGRLKAPRAKLVEALRGRVRDHHRFLFKLHLAQVDALQLAVRDVEARLGEALQPFHRNIDLLTTIPGISATTARVMVSEIGFDMVRFPSAAHLVSWAGLCPRSDECG
jgi:transposase